MKKTTVDPHNDLKIMKIVQKTNYEYKLLQMPQKENIINTYKFIPFPRFRIVYVLFFRIVDF